jgi:hypothetical protein
MDIATIVIIVLLALTGVGVFLVYRQRSRADATDAGHKTLSMDNATIPDRQRQVDGPTPGRSLP